MMHDKLTQNPDYGLGNSKWVMENSNYNTTIVPIVKTYYKFIKTKER